MRHLPLILVLGEAASMILGLLLRDLLQTPVDPRRFLEPRLLAPLLLVMPFVETAFIHSLWIEVLLKLGKGHRWALYTGATLAAITFFAMHYYLNGEFNGYVYGLVGGITLSTMYVLTRKDGAQRAFFWTWMLHLCSNSFMVLSMAFYGMAIGVT